MRTSLGTTPANIWQFEYLRQLRQRTSRDLARRVSRTAKAIFDERKDMAVDKPGLTIVSASALLLASYRELLIDGSSRPDAYEVTRTTALATFGRPTQLGIRALMMSGRPVSRMSWVFQLLARRFFGAGVSLERREFAHHTDFVVTSCAFNDFFAATEEPLLGRIVCEWDKNWMEPANRTARMNAVRPTTLSTNTGPCTFALGKTDMPYSGPVDIVLERRGEVASVLTSDGDLN